MGEKAVNGAVGLIGEPWADNGGERSMHHNYRMLVIALGAAMLEVTGCDPGYAYFPLDPRGNKLEAWTEMVDGVRFSVPRYFDLQNPLVTQQIEITNDTNSAVLVTSAAIETSDGESIEGAFQKSPVEKESRLTVSPGQSRAVSAQWTFPGDKYPDEVIGPTVTWVWHVRIGNEERVLRVRMEKD
jgi:hypothetical protein